MNGLLFYSKYQIPIYWLQSGDSDVYIYLRSVYLNRIRFWIYVDLRV